jgi:hypothetical protein
MAPSYWMRSCRATPVFKQNHSIVSLVRTDPFFLLVGQLKTAPFLLWTDVGLVRWRWLVVWRRCVSANSEWINVGIARARN